MKMSALLFGLMVSLGLTHAHAQTAPNFSGVQLTPATGVAFPLTYLGQSSPEQTVTLKNTYQGADWLITSVVPSDKQYEVMSETCTARPVAKNGGTCTVTVRYTPVTATLTSTAKINLTRTSAGGNFWIPASGQADVAPLMPTLPAAPTFVGVAQSPSVGLAFAELAPGQVSATQRLTIANTFQGTDHVITSVSSNSPAFEIVAESCTKAPVARKGGTCTVDVRFKPQAPGSIAGKLAFTRTSPGGNFFANLAGIGKGAATVTSYSGAQLSPSTLAFGDVQRGTQSAEQTVTLTNTTQQATWTVNSVLSNMTSYKVLGHSCGTLAPGASCAIRVAFAPAYAQTLNGTLTIHRTYNGVDSSILVKLSGTGINAGQLRAEPGTLLWANTPVGDTDASRSLSLTNTGATALTLGNPTVSASDFVLKGSCAGTLAPGATCTLPLEFAPKAVGVRTGTISLPHSGGPTPAVVQLSGTGTAQGILSPSTASLRFDDTLLGESSATQSVTLKNVGTAPLSLTQWSLSDTQFVGTSSTCGTLAPNATCQVGLRFVPESAGEKPGTLNITHTGKTGKLAISLSGYGYAPSGVRATPNAVALGNINLCDNQWCSNSPDPTFPSQVVTLTNQSEATITGVYLWHTDDLYFDYDTYTCWGDLGPGESCQVKFGYMPQGAGLQSNKIQAFWNESSRPLDIPVTATVNGAILDMSSHELRFPYTDVGTNGPVKRVTVTNVGNAPASGLQAELTGDDTSFALEGSNCSATLAVGGSCYYDVRFNPDTSDQHWNSLLVKATQAWTKLGGVDLYGNIGAGTVLRVNDQPTVLRWSEPNSWGGNYIEGVDISEGALAYRNTSDMDTYIAYANDESSRTLLAPGQVFTIPTSRGIGTNSRVILSWADGNTFQVAQFIGPRQSSVQSKSGITLLGGTWHMLDVGPVNTFMDEHNMLKNTSGQILELHHNSERSTWSGYCGQLTLLAPGESCSTERYTDITVTPQGSQTPTEDSVRVLGYYVPM